jgi:hypothetical protein
MNNYTQKLIKENPGTSLWSVTKFSKNEDAKIHPGYWAVGFLREDMYTVGGYILLGRIANTNNPEGKSGVFSSSTISIIDKGELFDIVTTQNSIYKVEKIS